MTDRRSGGVLRYVPWVILAGLVGGFVFIVLQKLMGFPQHIAAFVGSQIVQRGGYDSSLSGVIGWGVHLGVSFAYATLFAIITHLRGFPEMRAKRWGLGLVLVFVLGWLATLATAPAISLTISVLAGQGIPESLPGLNMTLGKPFWNHVAFFSVLYLLTLVAPDLTRARSEA